MNPTGNPQALRNALEGIYRRFNRKKYLHPDPIEFLHAYENIKDREVAGLVAASLAYGRVAQILKSVSEVLNILGPEPALFLKTVDPPRLWNAFTGFRHRFARQSHLAGLLVGIRSLMLRYGSLYRCFLRGLNGTDETILPALIVFARELTGAGNHSTGHLIPLPERGSACKRLNLFLRWMVRKDAVDPGGWDGVPPSKLIIPLDVHMHRVGQALGFTARKQADLQTALEITRGFKRLVPKDPLRYDFSLTRLGIRKDEDLGGFLDAFRNTPLTPPD